MSVWQIFFSCSHSFVHSKLIKITSQTHLSPVSFAAFPAAAAAAASAAAGAAAAAFVEV